VSARVAAHAAVCARCRARAAREAKLTEILSSTTAPQWPADRPLLPPAAAAVAAQSGGGLAAARRERAGDADAARCTRAPRLAPIPTLAAILFALAVLALLRPPTRAPRRIDLVSPPRGIAAAWSLATIAAALEPPLSGESLRLSVDDRDVTAASDVTPDFVVYTMDAPLSPGDHLVALELRPPEGGPVEERVWIVTAAPDPAPPTEETTQ
jgi:hypothetical protein